MGAGPDPTSNVEGLPPAAGVRESLAAAISRPALDYRSVEAIAVLLQPSHSERSSNRSSAFAANILTLSEFLLEEQVSRIKGVVAAEYAKLPLITELERELERTARASGVSEGALQISKEVLPYYLNIFIYHNAEHMLTVARDGARFAAAVADDLDLQGEAREGLIRRVTIAGIYHDTGNGRFPREKVGYDELDALRLFLRDRAHCNADPRLAGLRDLTNEDTVQIAADIVATVFVDRYATGQMISRREYLSDAVSELRRYGLTATEVDFLRRLETDEAHIVRNADVAASLEFGSIVKNTFTVYFEDVLKSEIFFGRSFGDARRKFISLLRGRFQTVFHGAATELSGEAAEGNLLINPDNRYGIFRELNGKVAQSDRELLTTLAHDRPLCEAMSRLVEANVRAGTYDIFSRPLHAIEADLQRMVGDADFEPYRAKFAKYRDRSFIALRQEEVNEIFQACTKEVEKVIDEARRDPRGAVRTLAEIYSEVRPESWQGHYLTELMRYAAEHPGEEFITAATVAPGGTPLVRRGDKSFHAFVVSGGNGSLLATVDGTVVNTIRSVNIAGEMSVLTGERTADLVVSHRPLELLTVSEEATRTVSSSPRLSRLLADGVAVRLANGEVVTAIEDQEIQRLFKKIFAANLSEDDPAYNLTFQAELLGAEIEGIAAERGWERKTLAAGEPLIGRGTEPPFVYVVTKGLVEVVLPDGTRAAHQGIGTILGEMSLFEPDHKAVADVNAARGDTNVVCIPRELIAKCKLALQLLASRRQRG